MNQGDIISRLESITDKIEYEEINIDEVYNSLILLISDIETSSNYDADFGEVRFDDLD